MTGTSGKDRQLNTKRRQTANAGFSLVELLIAVTVLAIIVIPLLHMFVTSTRINVKSRQTLRATTVAQDIMEGLKAYTLDEVRTQFTLPDGTISDDYFYPTEGFYIVNSSMIQDGVREIEELEVRDADGNIDGLDNEIYYFGIKNLKMQGGEYDALIKLDASTYTTAKAGSSGHDNAFNGKYYAETKSVSETGGSEKDSSYHEDSKLSKDALENIKGTIKDEIEAAGGTVPDGWDEIAEWEFSAGPVPDPNKLTLTERKIEVNLEPVGDSPDTLQCKATITFTYKAMFGGQTYTSNGRLGAPVKDISRSFSSGNFYLFYYPVYSSTEIDKIIFTLTNPEKLFDEKHPLLRSITLAKQIRSSIETSVMNPGSSVIVPDLSQQELIDNEEGYRAYLELNKGGFTLDPDKFMLRTNIQTNLADVDEDDKDIIGIRYDSLATTNLVTHLVDEDVSNKVTNVIYDIEITVYKAGAAEHFDKYNTPGFDDIEGVQRLATITNLN